MQARTKSAAVSSVRDRHTEQAGELKHIPTDNRVNVISHCEPRMQPRSRTNIVGVIITPKSLVKGSALNLLSRCHVPSQINCDFSGFSLKRFDDIYILISDTHFNI